MYHLTISLGARCEWVVNAKFQPHYPLRKKVGTHWIWGWVGTHKSGWTTWKEKKLNLPDRPVSNVRFTPTTIFRLQFRFSFTWDMAQCRWMFSFSGVECPIRTGFGRLKHLLFQIRHAVYLTLLNAACFGFLYKAMYKVEGRKRIKS